MAAVLGHEIGHRNSTHREVRPAKYCHEHRPDWPLISIGTGISQPARRPEAICSATAMVRGYGGYGAGGRWPGGARVSGPATGYYTRAGFSCGCQ